MKVCEHLDRLIEVLNFVAKGVMSKTEPSTRRELRFESLDEVLADVEILVSGGHRTVGNWTLAQILTHLQKTFDASIDGFGFESNWLIRKVLGPLFKKRFLTKPLPAGFKLPKSASAILPDSHVALEESFAKFQKAIARLKCDKPSAPHPGLGKLTPTEWNNLHLRHSELHLSFASSST